MKRKIDFLSDFLINNSLLHCPRCHEPLSIHDFSLSCKNKHSFDLNKKGYINFLDYSPKDFYDDSLFYARKKALEYAYKDLFDEINNLTNSANTILDAGCGEGFYLKGINAKKKIGLDISKNAIVAATNSYHGEELFVVGDLAFLPLGNNSVDIVLNILSPANYLEFKRVLRPQGVVIKVIPNKGYLEEIRALIASQLEKKDYSNQDVYENLENHGTIVLKKDFRKTVSLDEDMALAFLKMTPLTRGKDITGLAKKLTSVSIDLSLVVIKLS